MRNDQTDCGPTADAVGPPFCHQLDWAPRDQLVEQ